MSADLIARFGRTITVRSALSAGDYVNGMWQEPFTEEIQIVASVQRLTPKEVLLLKEADRQKESFKLNYIKNMEEKEVAESKAKAGVS